MNYNLDVLKKEIDKYVYDAFKDYSPQKIKASKAIHDTVLGTSFFEPFEIALLDSPIVQRLRRISQTDIASFVFPSGNHNRFEHTLGVATIAGKFADAILRKNDELFKELDLSPEYILQHCRVAAILHDVGHGPFSHLTEQVYASHFDYIIKNEERFSGASPHEILSFMIATSEKMRDFNSKTIEADYGVKIDLSLVGDIIVGFSKDKPNKTFMVEIINGAFDADKLDYMLRDAHSTGVAMSLDISRLLHTMDVVRANNKIRLCIDISGTIALEQIVFNKMTLFTTIYHHHKVRATGCLLKSLFVNNDLFKLPHNYLYYTDTDVWASDWNKQCDTLIKYLKNRNLPKRALAISSRTITQDSINGLKDIMNLIDYPDLLKDVENEIVAQIKRLYGGLDLTGNVWIDIPKSPKFKEASTCIIKNFSTSAPFLTLTEIFPVDQWVEAFTQNKWSAYVFSMPQYCEQVSSVSKMVLEDIFDVKFNEYAKLICKLQNSDS